MMKRILITTLLMLAGVSHAQTNTENYVQTRVYLDSTAITSTSVKQVESIQYFDGLGRAIQGVAVKASPTGKDIVSHIEYDAFGRQTKSYLPIPQSGTQNGAIYPSPLGNASSIYGGEKIYSETILENSPLNRVQQQIQVGNDWSGKPILFGYDANADGEVKKYTTVTSWTENRTQNTLSLSGNYPTGTLYKNSVTDEDGNRTEKFNNKKGQTILVRKKTETGNVDTYYVYNEYGQLVYTLPPLSVQNTAPDETVLNTLCYQYRYDSWNRLVEKKIPGKGWEYMVYDKADKLILTQDTLMKAESKWFMSKYDKWGRILYTSIIMGGTRENMQSQAGNVIITESKDSVGFTKDGIQVYYTHDYFHVIETVLSVNYYDTYPPGTPTIPTKVLGQQVLSQTPQSSGLSTKNFPLASYVKNIEDDNWTKNYIWYDTKGRSIGSHTINHLGGSTRTESELDFAGVTKQTKVYHKRLDTDIEKVITQTYTYDGQNRLLVHKHKVDNNTEEILTQNEYNELSQLKNKKVGGINTVAPLQSIDYQYNIRGWLTKINDPADLNGKLFGYEVKYTNPNYSQIAPGKYNGSITEIDWKTSTTDLLKRYTYAYDTLGRLKDGIYTEPSTTTPYNNSYNENITYDLNGNIKTLKRNGVLTSGPTATLVDDLVYEYVGNKLTKVVENAMNTSGYEGGNNNIDYDLNGNMTNMKDKGIQNISYNFLNLANLMSISQTNPKGSSINFGIEYLYRADGTKLRKINSTGGGKGSPTTKNMTDYLDGFQYTVTESSTCIWCRTSVAYEQEAFLPLDPLPISPNEWTLDFVPTSEGYYNFRENRYIYTYKDHLGNARVNFANNSAGVLEITDTNTYYPLGLNHIGGISKGNLGNYFNYKYNGKEIQETGFYDYGWRQYLPDLGRWNGIDQLSEKYLSTSPYAYVANNPISFVDPDGRWMDEAGHIDVSGKGKISFGGRQLMTQFMGQTIDQGAGGYSFTGNGAVSMFNYFANGGDINGLSFNNGEAKFWTGDATQTSYKIGDEMYGEGDMGIMHTARFYVSSLFDWAASHSNDLVKATGVIESTSFLVGKGLAKWNAGWEAPLMTKATMLAGKASTGSIFSASALSNASTGLKWFGRAVGAVGVGITAYQYLGQKSITGKEAAWDTAMGVVGFLGPWGAAASLTYFGGKALYEYYSGDTVFDKPNKQ